MKEAVLKISVKTPEVRELLIMDRNAGPIDSITSKQFGGTISSGFDKGLISDTIFLRSCIDIGLKQFNTRGKGGRLQWWEE